MLGGVESMPCWAPCLIYKLPIRFLSYRACTNSSLKLFVCVSITLSRSKQSNAENTIAPLYSIRICNTFDLIPIRFKKSFSAHLIWKSKSLVLVSECFSLVNPVLFQSADVLEQVYFSNFLQNLLMSKMEDASTRHLTVARAVLLLIYISLDYFKHGAQHFASRSTTSEFREYRLCI